MDTSVPPVDPAGPRRTPARTTAGRAGDPRAGRDPTAATPGAVPRDEVGAARPRAWRKGMGVEPT